MQDGQQGITTTKQEAGLLYSGAQAHLTEDLSYLLLFQYAVKHSLTTKAFDELIKIIKVFLPSDAVIPKSANHLKQFFLRKFPELCPSMQDYCEDCHKLLKAGELCGCNGKICQFVTVPIGPQLKARLESMFQ